MIGEPFTPAAAAAAVPYVRTEGTGAVFAGGPRRLPFQPVGEMLLWRNRIREAVRGLHVGPEELLHAAYASADDRFCDAENILFYNVGASAFRLTASQGLRFERRYRVSAAAASAGAGHEAVYRVSPRTGSFAAWSEGPVLARLAPSPLRSRAVFSDPAAAWLVVAEGPLTSFGTADDRPLMIRLRLTLRPGRQINCTGVIKPLLDGFLSAFHCMTEGPADAEIAVRLGRRLAIDPERVTALLRDVDRAVLGPRAVLHLRSDGVQWNPADHLCVACEVLVDRGDADSIDATVSVAEPLVPA